MKVIARSATKLKFTSLPCKSEVEVKGRLWKASRTWRELKKSFSTKKHIYGRPGGSKITNRWNKFCRSAQVAMTSRITML